MNAIVDAVPGGDVRKFRNALGSYGTGVAVVTAMAGDRPVGMTINSFASVSLDPALVLWSVGDRASEYDLFCKTEEYAIHILSSEQQRVSDSFAKSCGDKYAGIDWELDDTGVPRLKGCLARFRCKLFAVYPGGDHKIIVGEVRSFDHAGGSPLLFVSGRYTEALMEDVAA